MDRNKNLFEGLLPVRYRKQWTKRGLTCKMNITFIRIMIFCFMINKRKYMQQYAVSYNEKSICFKTSKENPVKHIYNDMWIGESE